jgi:N4-(beta-N-acetylglucosaminyl)-L-asparaginase
MSSRRSFITGAVTAAIGAGIGYVVGKKSALGAMAEKDADQAAVVKPRFKGGLALSTWIHGIPANEAAWAIIGEGGRAVDAAEFGVRVVEEDPTGTSVGLGGTPDRDGNVTLDACIMDETGNAGSVCYLKNILHPISVARKVMDETPHVILAGDGALEYAKSLGMSEVNLLTEESKQRWEEWLVESQYKPIINIENHDTIGLITMDQNGNLSGSCTTSGLGYKMGGRVGDSPIIGAGLFVDNEVGAATATGLGEAVLKTCGTFLVVELMRQGASPQEACEEAVMRIVKKQDYKDFQIGYIAVNTAGDIGAYAIQPGFNYALYKDGENVMVDAASYVKA